MTLKSSTLNLKPKTALTKAASVEVPNGGVAEMIYGRQENRSALLKKINKIYTDAVEYRETASNEQYLSLSIDDMAGEEVFLTLDHKLGLLKKVVGDLNTASEETVCAKKEGVVLFQKLYEELITLSNYVRTTYDVKALKLPLVSPIFTYSNLDTELAINEDGEVSGSVQLDSLFNEKGVIASSKISYKVSLLEVGPKGRCAAQVLREVLFVARDNDPVFIHNVRKQIAADKLIRELAALSAQGLTIDQVSRITELGTVLERDEETSWSEIGETAGGVNSLDSLVPNAPNVCKKIIIKFLEGDVSIIAINFTEKVHKKYRDRKREIEFPQKKSGGVMSTLFGSTVNESKILAEGGKDNVLHKKAAEKSGVIFEKLEIKPKVIDTPLIDLFVTDDKHLGFIKEKYLSLDKFEHDLKLDIAQIEAKATDSLERWLKEEVVSPFLFMQEMTVGEVLVLSADKNVRTVLLGNNIKYEAFVIWVDLIDEMQSSVSVDKTLLFGELYVAWVMKTELGYI